MSWGIPRRLAREQMWRREGARRTVVRSRIGPSRASDAQLRLLGRCGGIVRVEYHWEAAFQRRMRHVLHKLSWLLL